MSDEKEDIVKAATDATKNYLSSGLYIKCSPVEDNTNESNDIYFLNNKKMTVDEKIFNNADIPNYSTVIVLFIGICLILLLISKLYPKTLISRMPSLLNTLFYIFSMFLLVFGLLNVYILDGLHSLQYISENVINELKKDLKM
jgi:hypothetical protein|tara:strand:- start:455 stop:883 length:429 start_codon:yes stop_codon:yes gene_type:complete